MTLERTALLQEYLLPLGAAAINVPPYVAIPDFEVLKTTPSDLRLRFPITVEPLVGSKNGRSFVQTCSRLNYKFLWTHVDNDNYRDDYLAYVRNHHHVMVDAIPQNLHVDHLFSRARAKNLQLSFVRMILLRDSINTSHGAGYERARTQGRIGTVGNQRGLDEIGLMKLCGVASPCKGSLLTPPIRAHLQAMSVLFGIPVSELEQNVYELMDVAAFRPKP